jgi:hypothetical protein
LRKTDHYSKFHNLHEGETGIVVANGPSLADVPVDFLHKYPSLGCNRITHMYPDFVPNYYACLGWNQVDTPERRETIYPMLEDDRCEAAFINRMWAQEFPYDNVHSILGGKYYGLEPKQMRGFSMSPLEITGLGFTMTYVLLQIAFYMGFETVLIVGLDHHYPKTSKKHFYDDSEFPNFEVAPGPLYEDKPDFWRTGADAVFRVAEEVYYNNGRDIINLTDESRCTVFRKEALSDWLD